MNTRQLSQDPHVPAKASTHVAGMQPGSTNGVLVRESEALTEARRHKAVVPKPRKPNRDNLSHLGRTDHE